MKKIFSEYGGVIVVVIAVVALIGLVTLLMQPGGVLNGAFGNIVQSFVDKSESLIDVAGSGAGGAGGENGSGSASIIEWNSFDVVGNPSFQYSTVPLVKVSDLTPSIEELDGSVLIVNLDGQEITLTYDEAEKKGDFVGVTYVNDAVGSIFCMSAKSAGTIDGATVPEAGFYAVDIATAMSYNADCRVEPAHQ